MGCTNSAPMGMPRQTSPQPFDVVSATKRFFCFEEVPLSVQAWVKGSDGQSYLEVRAAGLEKSGLLGALCSGFLQRNFLIMDGRVQAVRGLFNADFRLRQNDKSLPHVKDSELDQIQEDLSHVDVVPLQKDDGLWVGEVSPNATPSKPNQQLKAQIFVHDVKEFNVDATKRIEEIDATAKLFGASLRVTLERGWTPFIRVALQKTIEAAGYRVMVAKLSTFEENKHLRMKDIFWLGMDPSQAETSGSGDCQVRPQEWMNGLINQLQNTQPGITPTRFFARQTSPEEVDVEVKQAAKVQADLRMAVLPAALRRKAKELPYKLKLDCDGEQFRGVQKYSGIGMAQTYKGTDVLEFATYFVKQEGKPGDVPARSSKTSLFGADLGRLLGGGDKFAEFVTQYDPTRKCLTIFKVFLNEVLPSKMSAGARAVAEQLLQERIPDMVGANWNGKAAVRELTRIHICDVVNWNTYALMSMSQTAPSSDTERWLFEEEAKASKVKVQDLKSLSTEEVFHHTALGKLVRHVLQLWKGANIANKAIQSVTMQIENGGELELICGEYRQMMDIVVTLKTGDP